MSEKKSKSKSKQKSQKGKDSKSKKSKDDKDDKKSKKSADKGSKKEKGSKKDDLNKSKVSKPEDNQSQDLSMFKPILFNPPPANIDESVCPFHNEKNTNFCEICEQVGCESCLVYGPHNNQMHRVSKLDECFKSRYLYLNQVVCGDLLAKRDKLNRKLQQLTILSDELRYVKGGIEKMTKIEYNEMMQRLNTNAGNKFAILNHQMASLQRDLEGINTLGNQFFELTNMNPENNTIPETNPHKGMVPFLLRSKFLQQQAQQLISKPIKTSIDVYPYDLPRQLTQKKLILDKNKGALDLLKVKDETIWMLLEQKKLMNQQLWQGFYEQAREQAGQWQKLNSKLRNQLQTFNMRCSKCGLALEENTVNQECQKGQYHYFLT